MRYIKYIPLEMREIQQYIELDKVWDEEYETIIDKINSVDNNRYLSTMDESMIEKWERLLDIKTDENLSIEERRDEIIQMIRSDAPYTMRTLKKYLDEFIGVGEYELTLLNDKFTLSIEIKKLDFNKTSQLINYLEKIVPCNMLICIIQNETSDVMLNSYIGGGAVDTEIYNVKGVQNV